MGEYFTADFPTHRVCAFREHIGHLNFPRLSAEVNKQREKAGVYLERLKDIPGIKAIVETGQAKASYPYLTLIFEDARKRKSALEVFKNSGLGISQVYLRAIKDYEYLKEIIPPAEYGHARGLAEKTVTLSTSSFLKDRDLENITEKLKKL